MPKVIVALSGGVDSAVAALILKNKGYEVYAVHMQNWDRAINEDDASDPGCLSSSDLSDVKKICSKLKIPLYTYNFVSEYWERVFSPYLFNLENNLNTNPDVACNSYIKFGVLLDRIVKDFGSDVKLATGHWAKIIEENGKYKLAVCSNPEKDQTYFLSNLSEYQLSKILFPLSDLSSKNKVREMAKKNGLDIWNKRDSTGICFIGKRNYSNFISKYISEKPGNFVDIENNQILGRHKGMHMYVYHQRSGLFLKGYTEKYYVCRKNPETNTVFLCKESSLQKYLYTESSRCRNIHWINNPPVIGQELMVKSRHAPSFFKATISYLSDSEIVFLHENRYVTSPGQRIVFYSLDKKICLGGGDYFCLYD